MVSIPRHHAEWLSLVEISGPFLSLSELLRVFPQGLEDFDSDTRGELKAAYEEWLDNKGSLRPDPAIHGAWVRYVLTGFLGMDEEVFVEGQAVPQNLKLELPEHGETIRPDFVLHEDGEPTKPLLLVQMYSAEQGLERQIRNARWQASPATRMMELLHATGTRIGLITNGEQWMLVDAPRGETTGFISWYANLWMEERHALRSFYSLLNLGRFFVDKDYTLEAMLANSANDQQEVTDQLGYQVREAVEILIQAIDRVDERSGRILLQNVDESRLYESALTIMMRLVFLMSAEERGLFLLGDPIYDQYYAVSTLRGQLRESADRGGEDVLQFRFDAWSRLLATFRAVHGGIQHEDLRLPAYGGSLFDPDRYPFLEGRQDGTHWRTTESRPLEISNRTVLHLLEALQILQVKVPGGGGAEARKLSFRALDIEQIGHVYEGLLDHQAQRADEVILGLTGTKNKEPEIALSQLETLDGDALIAYLNDVTGRSTSALANGVNVDIDDDLRRRLLVSCGNDSDLFDRLLPYASLLRSDSNDYPYIIQAGSLYVTSGTTRRATGTHYTPKSLTEPIVQHTLEPLVYIGPAEGYAREDWQLKPPAELLDLKICDMAMGSGAFLVQTVRYLSERLLEAWQLLLPEGGGLQITPEGKPARGRPDETIIPDDPDERLILAKRLIADRCIYGVDKNPLAVEMGKLSLWLITLQKGRAFTFLDHALKAGDSLVGVDLEQLRYWNLKPDDGQEQFIGRLLEPMIERAIELRRQIEAFPVLDIRDQQEKARLLEKADNATAVLKTAADHLIAEVMGVSSGSILSDVVDLFKAIQAGKKWEDVVRDSPLPPADELGFTPFHWELEFPEVFLSDRSGFDGFVGNPPFIGGSKIREALGGFYRDNLYKFYTGVHGNADICAIFFIRGFSNLRYGGNLGLLATNTIAQGDTRQSGLEKIVSQGGEIYRAINNLLWPGTAAVDVSVVWINNSSFRGVRFLDDRNVDYISYYLDSSEVIGNPGRLANNKELIITGSKVYGSGFILSAEEARMLIANNQKNSQVILPYLNGRTLNSHPEQTPDDQIIYFSDREIEAAREYPEVLEIVIERVKPDREKNKRKHPREYWWQYEHERKELYNTIESWDRVIVTPETSKYCLFAFVSTTYVYSHTLKVVLSDDSGILAILISSFHNSWAWKHGSTMRNAGIKYSSVDIFETFPFPTDISSLEGIGERYHETRREIMLARQEGLTNTYNRFHDPDEDADDIEELRQLHVEMDEAVASAYDWDDLDLGHGFHETAQGIRFTISEAARREVLTRLLKLNHQRYREELLQGLHKAKDVKVWLSDHPEDAQFISAGKVPMKKKPKKSPSKKQSSYNIKGSIKPFGSDDSPTQFSMFDEDE